MRSMLQIAAATALVAAAGTTYAQSGAEVVKAKGCLGCHDLAAKKIGPSFTEVAAKYKGDKAAPALLADKLKEGKGHAKIAASDAELKAAVGYVLATK
jgi:cytochrome c551/c552